MTTTTLPDRALAAFLFDMDGTILTSIKAAERVWGRWAQSHGQDVFAVLTLEGSVAARDHVGGTAPNQVRRAIERVRGHLNA